MPTVVLKAARAGQKWIVFRDDDDLSDIEESALVTWEVDTEEPNTGSLIRTNDHITVFNLTPSANGSYNPGAYNLAYQVSFALEHCKKVTGPGVALISPTREQLETLPLPVLAAYVARADTSRAMSGAEIDSLKRRPSGGGETTDAQNGA